MIEVKAYKVVDARLAAMFFVEEGREFGALYFSDGDEPTEITQFGQEYGEGVNSIESLLTKGDFSEVYPPVAVPNLHRAEAYAALNDELHRRFNSDELGPSSLG